MTKDAVEKELEKERSARQAADKRIAELLRSTFAFKKSMQFMNLFVRGLEIGTSKEELEAYF